jgi:hypothetical protein
VIVATGRYHALGTRLDHMKKALFTIVLFLFLTAAPFADESRDWAATSGDPAIVYRWQEFDNSYACFLEYRDQQQGTGYTTFDAVVDYRSTDLDPTNNRPIPKTDNEHITTAPNRTASARIANCVGVLQATVSLVQRH